METTGSKPIDRLVRMACEGNGPAFTALWDTHIDQLRAYIHHTMKNLSDFDVDDICSRSFEKAFRQIGTYNPVKGQFFTWLKTIARNTGLDFIDSEAKVHPKDQIVYLDDGGDVSGVERIASPGKNPLDSIISDEEHEKTVGYVTRLPELYRTVAMKRVIDGMKYNEIAEDLGMGLNTVKTRIKRAKAMVDRMRADDEGK